MRMHLLRRAELHSRALHFVSLLRRRKERSGRPVWQRWRASLPRGRTESPRCRAWHMHPVVLRLAAVPWQRRLPRCVVDNNLLQAKHHLHTSKPTSCKSCQGWGTLVRAQGNLLGNVMLKLLMTEVQWSSTSPPRAVLPFELGNICMTIVAMISRTCVTLNLDPKLWMPSPDANLTTPMKSSSCCC